jgi:hypothetical protein
MSWTMQNFLNISLELPNHKWERRVKYCSHTM